MKTLLTIAGMLIATIGLAQVKTTELTDEMGNKQFSEYSENGELKDVITIEDGVVTVVYYSYHENGELASIKCFRDKQAHGTWWTYTEKGIATAMANYDNGKKTGTWLFWDEQGIQKTALRYEDGNRIACQEYSPNGEILIAGCR